MAIRLLGILLLLLLLACSEEEEPIINPPTPPTEPPNIQFAEHPIVIRFISGEAKFYNTTENREFVPRGVNYFNIVPTSSGGFEDWFFHVGTFNESEIRTRFRQLVNQGYNVVRIFLDTCADDPGCIGNLSGPGLNRSYVSNISRTMQIAKEENIFLLLTSNDLPDQGGYWEMSNTGASEIFSGYRNAHYLTEPGVQSAIRYWNDLFEMLNDTGADYSHVMAWSILNEQWYFINEPPFNLNSGIAACANGQSYNLSSELEKRNMAEDNVVHYIQEITEIIKTWDPNGLVTMGFFAPNRPHPWRINDFKYVETAKVVRQSDLDFYDFHAYPGTFPLDLLVENFSVTGYTSKPVIMGEVGAFIDLYKSKEAAINALQNWTALSCEYGYDGWLYWGLFRAPEAIGDATWGLLDDQEILIELSPGKYEDACTDDWRPPLNLALNKSVTASRALTDEPPSNAVDGNINTQWGSGSGPPQWIEVDFGEEITISEIALTVGQFPEGATIHEIRTKGEGGNYTLRHSFNQVTTDNDRLIWQSGTSIPNVRYLRISSTSSPSWISWKEIEVF